MADLIDRGELRERIYSRFGRHSTKVIATVEEGRVMSDWAFLEPFLNASSTIEAEPVRHGRWIEDGEICGIDKYKCSLCGGEVGGLLDNTKYCCFCGARMDGGADNVSNV